MLLDVDGTLIDSNYQHALSWRRALRDLGLVVPLVRLHRHIGMGGDQLVGSVAGKAFDAECGDAAREAEQRCYAEISANVSAMEGASELIAELRSAAVTWCLPPRRAEDTQRYLSPLGTPELKHTTSADVEATKPQPDLVHAALELATATGRPSWWATPPGTSRPPAVRGSPRRAC